MKFFIVIWAAVGFFSLSSTALGAEVSCKDCNVIVIAMDALQAAHVHHLGYSVSTTPHLDELAKKGYSFRQAISPSSWTVPTYLSIFSSMYPSAHGLTNRYVKFNSEGKEMDDFRKRKPEIQTMAQIFKANGYTTGGFTGDAGVSAILGYDKGFDSYTDETQFGGLDNSSSKALNWLARVKDKKFFLFVHGYDSHGQFKLPDGYKSRFSKTLKSKFKGTKEEQAEIREAGLKGEAPSLTPADLAFWHSWYDGKIADADERVGKFLAELKKQNRLDKTVVIVLADHGTEFYEHGRFDHGHTLYDELVRVPWIISLPGQKMGKIVDAQVSTLDLLPTLIEMTGIKADSSATAQIRGQSVVGILNSKGSQGHDVFMETDYRNYTHKRALRTADGWKYIQTLENGSEELFDLKKDPKESKNLASTNKPRLQKLKEILNKHVSALPPPAGGTTTGCLPVYQGQCEYYQ